jgi:hypothetical protein
MIEKQQPSKKKEQEMQKIEKLQILKQELLTKVML